MRLLIFLIIFLGFGSTGLAQGLPKKLCYQEQFPGDEKIFNRMDVYPNYKGYVDKLNQFLINQINIDNVMNSLPENIRLLTDTIDMKFIVTKTRQMVNLSVDANNNVIRDEVRRALIYSSCNWNLGSSGGRNLNGWFKNKLVLTFDRRGRFLSMKAEWLEPFAK